MSALPTLPLYLALLCYALGTLAALTSLFSRTVRLQHTGLVLMIVGFVAHTAWIGTICVHTGHPPLTNLPEAASFVAWTIFALELALWIRYRVHAAAFFVYPLVLLLLTLSAVVGENFTTLDPEMRSGIFVTHLLLSTVGVAGLLVGVAFGLLAFVQDRALKEKRRGRLWEWIPNLEVCKRLSYRALAIGFSIYTLGLIAGVVWSYKMNAELIDLRTKQVGAVTAWILFAALLQQYIAGAYRQKRTVVLAACAFAAVIVAILGIAR